VARLGDFLAAFYAGLPAEADVDAYVGRLAHSLERDREIICLPEFSPAPRGLLDAAEAALVRAIPEIRARAARGRLVEGHGDLRPEHVCLTDPLRIFDCLDFDRVYRMLDPYDEIAYLGLECGVLGADWVGPALLDRVAARLGDPPSEALLSCYGALSALTRARLCLAHLLERPVRLPAKWRPLARRYLSAAEARLAPERPGAQCAGRA
jgi:aminoglycoside phosphotransferase family enzyme